MRRSPHRSTSTGTGACRGRIGGPSHEVESTRMQYTCDIVGHNLNEQALQTTAALYTATDSEDLSNLCAVMQQ